MRQVINPQPELGSVNIGEIKLDPRSRDDIPQILRGLQHIWMSPALRDEVFKILEQVIPTDANGKPVSAQTGRPGMEQWRILVLGSLRLGINADYDRLQEFANQHNTVRQFLGHSDWCDDTQYSLQRLRDNLRLFTPEILDQINQAVVRAGHVLVKKKPSVGPTAELDLYVRVDSFVVETHVHYPTDLNLLWDAIRKLLSEGHQLAQEKGLPDWRQTQYHQRRFKQQLRRIQNTRRRKGNSEAYEADILGYLNLAQNHLVRARGLCSVCSSAETQALNVWKDYAVILEDQIVRRILQNEVIPHEEKLFSLFQPHTEWISKGKAGVPVELGLRVHVVEDQHQFILHHVVAMQQTDEKLAVPLVRETRERFGNVRGVSMDKGYHSPSNQCELRELVERVTLPKKGRLNAEEQSRESDPEFQRHRRQHSAVESAINGLEQGGLDRCRDHGIDGFKRYVAMAVVARNIKRIGALLRRQEREQEQRKRGPYKKAA